ncbi:hypothetical protein QOT17_011277 [Balamuthia mandrillaris]
MDKRFPIDPTINVDPPLAKEKVKGGCVEVSPKRHKIDAERFDLPLCTERPCRTPTFRVSLLFGCPSFSPWSITVRYYGSSCPPLHEEDLLVKSTWCGQSSS